MHAPMQCFHNALENFPTAISYECKLIMKSTPASFAAAWVMNKKGLIAYPPGRLLRLLQGLG
jgi:hypothetical protein